MSLEERIQVLVELGKAIKAALANNTLEETITMAYHQNPWFTPENSKLALSNIADYFLDQTLLYDWTSKYQFHANKKNVGIIAAGNIPAVAWHDLQCNFVCGHKSLIKYSTKDSVLIPYLIDVLVNIDQRSIDYFEDIEQLKNFDAVIATGSNNSARYFESYFGKYAHIIRKNRNGVAVLHGDESQKDIVNLGIDIFTYFGQGCRNISKIYVPEGYDFQLLLEGLHDYNEIIHHHKYKNNFDYNIALYLLNKQTFKNNGCILLLEDDRTPSRIATLHYEYYENQDKLIAAINSKMEEIQCIVSQKNIMNLTTILPGETQTPHLSNYADGVDTMQFLTTLI